MGENAAHARSRFCYFAWVREKVGKAEENVELPAGVETVAELVGWLKRRGPQYAEAFARPRSSAPPSTRCTSSRRRALGAAREIAFFPPVTGG